MSEMPLFKNTEQPSGEVSGMEMSDRQPQVGDAVLDTEGNEVGRYVESPVSGKPVPAYHDAAAHSLYEGNRLKFETEQSEKNIKPTKTYKDIAQEHEQLNKAADEERGTDGSEMIRW